MEANEILSSELLDIVFENRNKEYGAYELRKQYESRLSFALLITGGIGLIIFLTSFLFKPKNLLVKPRASTVVLTDLPPKEKPVEIEKPKTQIKQVKTEQFVTMVVKPDRDVTKKDIVPPVDDLYNALIGTDKKDGDDFDGTVQKPTDNTKEAVGEGPVDKDNNKGFVPVEIEAEFPGGNEAWNDYISKAINRNIDELQEDGKSGTVVAIFVVDAAGNVSDVRILPCNETGVSNCLAMNSKLAEVAVAAIKRGPRWKPAIQNGVFVKAYRRQPVTIRLTEN